MDTLGLVGNKNLELWNYLESVYKVEICKENRSDYLTFSKGNKATIFVPLDETSEASFTHELLHIYIRTKNIFIGSGLRLSIKQSKILSSIFSDYLIDHIGNCLDHFKMLPIFIKMGFHESEFITDYSTSKLTKKDISLLKSNYTLQTSFKKVYNSSAVCFLIGKYFAANSCCNKEYNYSGLLVKLKIIDSNLFQILEIFLDDWKNFDFENSERIVGSYHLLLFDFINNLEKWAEEKTFD